jgi:8-oxo-dGTP pyrophosphatase MutT (NUDIX family)
VSPSPRRDRTEVPTEDPTEGAIGDPGDHEPVERRDPWTTLASREVYANPWIRVREDEVLRPDGSPGIYGVVTTSLAVGVVALTEADEVVLVGQWRYTLGAYSWEIVEGGAGQDEDGLSAIRRELVEEAGYEADHWERLGHDIAISNSVTDEIARVWLARGLRPVPDDPDPTEELEVRLVAFDDALAMIDRGQITDSITSIALLTLDRRRRGEPPADGGGEL